MKSRQTGTNARVSDGAVALLVIQRQRNVGRRVTRIIR